MDESDKKDNLLNKLIWAFWALNLLVLLGGGWFIYTQTVGYDYAQTTEIDEYAKLIKERVQVAPHPLVFTMDPFIVNLKGRPMRTIKVEVNVELLNKEGFEEVINVKAEGRDAVVSLLNSKEFAEIEGVQGKLSLKDELVQRFNKLLKRGIVSNIYFTEFVIQ